VALKGNIKGPAGATGATGPSGSGGPFGGAVTIELKFNTGFSDDDPGNGYVKCNDVNQNTATAIRLSNVDVNLIDITGLTTTFDSSASTPKGHIRLVKKNDPTKYIIFKNGAVTAGFGAPYKNILVTALAWSSANPFAADDRFCCRGCGRATLATRARLARPARLAQLAPQVRLVRLVRLDQPARPARLAATALTAPRGLKRRALRAAGPA
jgi:hypothetical protein